ncbi:hypothetical protein ABT186_01950 [Streptomyces sp. NPDC001634]|uniref:hypothetical protein n=1 Tax=Streptomyces sp. NPDC001634 TaxID=3154390 RepID=UPI00332D75B1
MPNRNQLRETAINLLVESDKKERAGEAVGDHYRTQVQPAVDAALAAGCSCSDIHSEATRRFGQWLIDNAGR